MGRSPSGRFQLLSGFLESGDYVYRRLVVLDAQTGVILDLDNASICPVTAVDLGHPIGRQVTGEDEVRWLVAPDRLLISGTLYNLTERTTAAVGSLAR